MNIYQKLNAARERFHSTELKKTGYNSFAKYYYFELGDFLIPALKIFNEHGLCAIVSFDKDNANMCIVDMEKPDSTITISSPMGSAALKGCHEVQNIGAVETYQRRYLWVAALEIVEHDAIDASDGVDKDAPKPDVATILNKIATSADLPLLKTNFNAAIKMLNEENHPAVIKAKDKRKSELEKATT